ncbi:MAG: LacI family DNA-binding transcriptional regulator [Chloroflexota bacterium]
MPIKNQNSNRTTIRDVAREAGVSYQTVSRVINEKAEVNPSTRERVLAVMNQLNYQPNRIARSLTTQRTNTIGLVVSNIANPYFSDVALGVQHMARQHDYNVFVCNTGWDTAEEKRVLNSLAAQRVDGIVLHSSRISDDDLQTFSKTYGRPLLLSGREFNGPGISTTNIDEVQGATLAIEHLKAKGHTAIGLLVGEKTPPTMSNGYRLTCFCRALEACGLPVREDWIMHGALTAPGGHQSTRRLLPQAPEVTALLAHNDLVAIGAVKACQELGRQVPQQVAVVGFSNIDLAALVTPDLTTVHVDRYELGQQVIARLLEMIDEPDKVFPPLITPANRLIMRDSA